MNIMQRVTLRHLKQNKKRSLVTILGVIISVAMFTAVTTLSVSFMDLLRRQTMAYTGNWHVGFQDVQVEDLEELKADENIDSFMVYRNEGYAYLEGSKNQSRPYVYLNQYSDEMFENFNITLTSGRYPEKTGEVLITDELNKTSGLIFRVGDTLDFDFGLREAFIGGERVNGLDQTYPLHRDEGIVTETLIDTKPISLTVVGTIERPVQEPTYAPAYTLISYLDPHALADETVNVALFLKDVKQDIYEQTSLLATNLGIETVDYNSEALRYYGVTGNDSLRFTLYSLAAIVLTIIVAGSVSLIYNAFAISVSERTRHLGMLSSVGATRKQKKNSVYFEGLVIGLIAIPIGLICGLGGIGLTFIILNNTIKDALNVTETLLLKATLPSILVSVLLAAVTIFISTVRPARLASKVSAIDAIRQAQDVNLNGKALKTSKISRKLFGLEGEIAVKNMKRNRKRYLTTVLSITLSIVLFLSVSYFTNVLSKGMVLGDGEQYFDILIQSGKTTEENSALVNNLRARTEVNELTLIRKLSLMTWLDEELLTADLRKIVKESPDLLTDGKYPHYLEIYSIDDYSYQLYLDSISMEQSAMELKDEWTAIMFKLALHEDVDAGTISEIEASKLAVGDSLELIVLPEEEGEDPYPIESLHIIETSEAFPFAINKTYLGGISFLVSDSVFEDIAVQANEDQWQMIYLTSDDPMATQYALDDLNDSNLYIYNQFQSHQRSRQLLLLLDVFIYAFIILMTLISIANIFNTISTGIAMRRREFAMLKSVGMTPKGFSKMIRFESLLYGLKSLSYGLPISFATMLLIHYAMSRTISFAFEPPWLSLGIAIITVFLIVSASMLYSSKKMRDENIVDAIKDENA